MANKAIPNYALYGDQDPERRSNLLDFEWIPKRSLAYNWNISPHKHEAFIQILFMTEGSSEVILDSARLTATAPCLIIIPAQTVHGFVFTKNVNGPVVTAAQGSLESVATLLMPELLTLLRKPALIALNADDVRTQGLMPIFLAIERETQLHALGQIAAGLSLVNALCVQIARLSNDQASQPQKGNTRKVAQIEKFRALVEQNYKTHWPVTNFAEQMGITAGQLTRLCRESLGLSAMDVINARLVHEAQRDLVYTTASIKQLAFSLGFTDENYFGRFFRKHTGLSPSEFRTQALKSLLN